MTLMPSVSIWLLKSKAGTFVFIGKITLSQILASTHLVGFWLSLHFGPLSINFLSHFLKSSKKFDGTI